MHTLPITVGDLMSILSNELDVFGKGICNDDAINEQDVFFCFLKQNSGYCDYLTSDLDAMEQYEDNVSAMFAKAASVLIKANADQTKTPSTYTIMRRMSSLIAVYIYVSEVTHCKVTDGDLSTQEILDKPYTENDAKEAAVRMGATYGGICSEETLKSVYICIVKLLQLLWSTQKEELLLAQKNRKWKIESLVSGELAED